MEFSRPGFDVGLFSNRRDEQLAFWQQTVGLAYDHMGKLGGGMQQHRHHMAGAILKMNHARESLPVLPPSGYAELIVAREGETAPRSLADPDGNRVTLVPPGFDGILGYALKVAVNDPAAHAGFYRDVIGLAGGGPNTFLSGSERLIVEAAVQPVERVDEWRAPGFRYITFQVADARAAFAAAEAKGTEIGQPLRELGGLVRFGFIRDPDGNWIELSERTTFTGKAL